MVTIYFMAETSKIEWSAASATAGDTGQGASRSHAKSDSKMHKLIERIRAFRHRMPLAVRLPLAFTFLVLGILGLFLPILQGGLFLFIGFWLLFPDHSEKFLEKIKAKLKKSKKKPEDGEGS
jgi:hypothetical protein